MIDLHTHTLWSDGELIPAEHVRRAINAGYEAIALTDHADSSNIEELCREGVQFASTMNRLQDEIKVLSGLELTHILPEEIAELTNLARSKGVSIVVVHGETIAEPVRSGTNLAAINACVDILAHPGLISEDEVRLAGAKGVYLEITARRGHSLTNGHVARLACLYKSPLVIDTDSHSHNDFITDQTAGKILMGTGVGIEFLPGILQNSRDIIKKALHR
ncbi:MAG: histidinol phosphate phosphatase domain-containing protein [Brevinematales bacterium]|jgi:histidinol phosphatase-like PHP family hydrolase